MTAELLRRAASLMRERAEAATPGPWESLNGGDRLVAWRMDPTGQFDGSFVYVAVEPIESAENATHIAAWHPAVALAVADWLDATSRVVPIGDDGQPLILSGSTFEAAITVARAYLGEPS